MANLRFWSKIIALSVFCIVNIYLFVISCGISYQRAIAEQQIKFRAEMPTMDTWINSPFGKLKSYLFNVTNAEEFLSGRDQKIKLEEVGPIVYKIVGYNDVLKRTENSITYSKHRYRHVEFSPEESISPDILNKTIIQFNNILLGAAVKLNNELAFTKMAFNAVTIGEPIFLTDSIYYFLWEYTRPSLQFLSKMTNLDSNCGTLFNALKEKQEVYTVNIGDQHGLDNFFRIQTLNDRHLIYERSKHTRVPDESCPINVQGSFDNSLFPPFVTKDTPLTITASESCRVLPLNYQREQEHDGILGYRYSLFRVNETAPKCMDNTYGVRLPRGMFDVSQCVINDAPSAFAAPHFYGSAYNWSEHFEGLNPNAEEHEPHLILEPITGIPINERYRFMTSTPLPKFHGFNSRLLKLSNMMVPTFWYEFEVDHLPNFILMLIRFNVYVVPIMQPILMALQLLIALWCLYMLFRVCDKRRRATNVTLETVFNQKPQHDPMQGRGELVKAVIQ